jgi:thiamine kinase-like enzyme
MDKARKILLDTFGSDQWTIEKPKDGMQKECYIAHGADGSLFIKFDAPSLSLQRLGEIGVTPPVLASGSYNGQAYIIQEYVVGAYPTRAWIKGHTSEVASAIKRYHTDQPLTALLAQTQQTNYALHLTEDMAGIGSKIAKQPAQVGQVYAQLMALAAEFEAVPLVPVHNEPNTKNMLVSANKLFFIDWDEIVLSDPLRDIGTFAWWYLPENQWQSFFTECGVALNEDTKRKAYWFAALASLVVLLWRAENGYDDGGFLGDCLAALALQPNPRGYE